MYSGLLYYKIKIGVILNCLILDKILPYFKIENVVVVQNQVLEVRALLFCSRPNNDFNEIVENEGENMN